MTEPNYDKVSFQVNGEDVILDPVNLKFNEANLSQFLEFEGSWYDHFGRHLANAETELAAAKEVAEVAYLRAFDAYKAEGSSDKRAEAQARIEQGVIDARHLMMEADKRVKLLKQHLRAFDKVHENAISLGHNLRKEMDLTGTRIYSSRRDGTSGQSIEDYEAALERVVGRNHVS